jgi:hypothetical protein
MTAQARGRQDAAGRFGVRPGLPGPLSRFWPDPDPGRLRAAGHAWHTAAGRIERMNAHLDQVIASLTDSSRGEDVTTIDGFWAPVHLGGDQHTVLGGLRMICTGQGDACDKFAATADPGHHLIKLALGVGIAIIGTTAAGFLLTVVTLGGSDAAAGAADVAEAEAALAPVATEVAAQSSPRPPLPLPAIWPPRSRSPLTPCPRSSWSKQKPPKPAPPSKTSWPGRKASRQRRARPPRARAREPHRRPGRARTDELPSEPPEVQVPDRAAPSCLARRRQWVLEPWRCTIRGLLVHQCRR